MLSLKMMKRIVKMTGETERTGERLESVVTEISWPLLALTLHNNTTHTTILLPRNFRKNIYLLSVDQVRNY